MSDTIDKRLLLTSEHFIKQKEYWENKLSGDLEETRLLHRGGNANGSSGEKHEPIDIDIPAEVSSGLITLSNRSDLTIYVVLLAALKALIYRYSNWSAESKDITVISPVYEPNLSEDTFNRLLFIRDSIEPDATFKDILLRVGQSVQEAYENQDYPLDELKKMAVIECACLLTNIHNPENIGKIEEVSALNGRTGKVVFAFERWDEQVKGSVLYHPGMYERHYIQQFSNHFARVTGQLMQDLGVRVSDVVFLSREERTRLLVTFNDTRSDYPCDRLLHQLFEEQAARTPDHAAVAGPSTAHRAYRTYRTYRTYITLDEKSNQLAYQLQVNGVTPGSIVGILLDRSIEMVTAMLAVLKAGAAYLPIDPDYPEERVQYMLKDSGAKVLLTNLPEGHHLFNCQLSIVNCQLLMSSLEATLHHSSFITHHSGNLAYIIYTSGTTGRPKGVMIEHRRVVNVLNWFGKRYRLRPGIHVLQLTNYDFDPSVEQIFGTLLHGGVVHVVERALAADFKGLRRYIEKHQINMINFVPYVLDALVGHGKKLESLEVVISGGEKLSDAVKDRIIEKGYNLYNHYGPTETTIDALSGKMSEKPVNLGKPIANVQCYIIQENSTPAPVGVTGELCIAGEGLARGYLNNPELTAERFIRFYRSYRSYRSYISYRTGDLARWLPDGNIEFLGRMDSQVKIRGFRIELGEIENRLLTHKDVKEAVVLLKSGENGEPYLCAYIIPGGEEVNRSELHRFLSHTLPDYMIPSCFISMESLPLTPTGKIDRKALPDPETGVGEEGAAAPSNEVEERLVDIWSEVLGIDKAKIGIDANFFELGGHSLKINLLVSRIHKEFHVKIELADVFMIQTIRELAGYIQQNRETNGNRFTSIEPAEKKEYYLLSSAQKRLYAVQYVEKESIGYNVSLKVTVEGELDKKRLEQAFHQLIKRHENLRTSIEIIEGEPVQRVHDQAAFKIEYYDNIGSPRQGIHHFIRPFNLSRAPLLRAGLIELEPGKHLLMVDMHHIISDGISLAILVKEFMAFYGGEELSPLRIQYKDVSQWRNNAAGNEKEIEKQEAYWLTQFQEEIPELHLPTDFPRPAKLNFEGNHIRFEVGREELEMLRNLALEEDTTLYTVTLAVFYVLLAKLSGREDIVVGTVVNGRGHADLENVVGMLLNTLALRNYPRAEKTFKEFLKEVKERTLDAFENQEYPFEELVRKRNAMFDVAFGFENDMEAPGMEMAGLKIKPYDYKSPISKFDMTFIGEQVAGKLFFLVEYSTQLFKKKTIENLWNYYMEIAACAAKNKNLQLKDINISHDLLTPKADMPDIQLRF